MAPLLDVQSGISALLESTEKIAWVSGQQCGLVVIKANCTLCWIKRTTTGTSSEVILSLCWSLSSSIWHSMAGFWSITTGKMWEILGKSNRMHLQGGEGTEGAGLLQSGKNE